MKDLTKLETVASLSAVRAVLDSAPYEMANDNPLKTAEQKLQDNLNEFNEEEIRRATT